MSTVRMVKVPTMHWVCMGLQITWNSDALLTFFRACDSLRAAAVIVDHWSEGACWRQRRRRRRYRRVRSGLAGRSTSLYGHPTKMHQICPRQYLPHPCVPVHPPCIADLVRPQNALDRNPYVTVSIDVRTTLPIWIFCLSTCIFLSQIPAYVYLNIIRISLLFLSHTHLSPGSYLWFVFCSIFITTLIFSFFCHNKFNGHLCHGAHWCPHNPAHMFVLFFHLCIHFSNIWTNTSINTLSGKKGKKNKLFCYTPNRWWLLKTNNKCNVYAPWQDTWET